MNFRDCLLLIFKLFWYREGGFDAKEFSLILQNHLMKTGYAAKNPGSMRKVSIKRISNDLDRLYRMGFLHAQRAKREITSRSGRRCNRGYKYKYRISRQGLQYHGYLVNPEQARLKNEKDKTARLIGISIRKIKTDVALGPGIPQDVKDIVMDFQDKQGGRYKRFPLRYEPSLAQKYAVARKLLRNHGVTDIEFARELEKLTFMANVMFPHSELVDKIISRREMKTMLDVDGDNRHFLGLLTNDGINKY
jgi:hypothetical protein